MTIWASSANGTPAEYWWVLPVITVLSLVLGSGGFVTWRRLTLDRKLGVAAQESSEEDAISARWERMINAQTASLVEPLRERLKEVSAEVGLLEKEVEGLREELAAHRSRYWRAIQYVRTLLTWIRARVGHAEEPPPPPTEIAGDI